MSKSKYAPALFEVMRKAKPPAPSALAEPHSDEPAPGAAAAMRPSDTHSDPRADEAAPSAPPTADTAPQVAEEPDRGGPVLDSLAPAAAELPSAGREPPIRLDGGVIRVVLTSTQTAGVIFVILVLLLIAFGGGRSIGLRAGESEGFARARSLQAEPPDDLRDARQQGVTPQDVFEGVGTSPIAPKSDSAPKKALSEPKRADSATVVRGSDPVATPSQPLNPWVQGMTYICVQDFKNESKDDAQRAQDYLRQHGIDTVLVEKEAGSWRFRLISRQGFDREDTQQRQAADELLRHLRNLGEEYYKTGGRYKLQGYFVKLTQGSW